MQYILQGREGKQIEKTEGKEDSVKNKRIETMNKTDKVSTGNKDRAVKEK